MNNQDLFIKEIFESIDELCCADLATKKAINEKYNLSGSKKVKEIEHELLGLANEVRKTKTGDFTQNDYRAWNNYWNCPSSKKKIKEAIENESEEWINFILNIYLSFYQKSHRLIHEDRRYSTLLSIKAEMSSSYIERKNIEENIYNILTDITSSFKNAMYERFIDREKSRFNEYAAKKDLLDEELYDYKKESSRGYSAFIEIKRYSKNFDWNIYQEYLTKEFESHFSYNLKSIASRIYDNGKIDINSLNVISLNNDPKFLELFMEDINKNLIHCRSILAAEYSDYMIPHYRYIITIKNAK